LKPFEYIDLVEIFCRDDLLQHAYNVAPLLILKLYATMGFCLRTQFAMVSSRRTLIPKRNCPAHSLETCNLSRDIHLKLRRRSQRGIDDEHNSDVENYASVI
jgi:hypothetical protein